MIKILIVDDHAIVRYALRFVINGMFGEVFIQEKNNAADALTEIKTVRYDLVILDMNLGDTHFNKLLGDIMKVDNSLKILVLTMNNPVYFARHVLRQGASGFLNKDANEYEMRKAIELVLLGKSYLPKIMADGTDNIFSLLSDKEFEIMILFAKGRATGEIAALLNLKSTTISSHMNNIFKKLNVSTRADLTRLALEHKLWY